MVHVAITMWPHGDRSKAYPLGEVTIANVGGSQSRGNYRWRLFKRGTNAEWKSGSVEDFPRTRLGAYDLLHRVLKLAVGDRNP